MRRLQLFLASVILTTLSGLLATWFAFYQQGKRFALRDRLQKADAIIVLAGTRGKIAFLGGKVRTAVYLYQHGWAPYLICSGKFSVKVTETPRHIAIEELRVAVAQGRIQEKDIQVASEKWDIGLGAHYMRDKAIQLGVPEQALLVEDESLHTRENAEYVLKILQQHQMQRVILVTSPFHQLRTYLTFAKVFQPHGVKICNYYADTDEWHPAIWFLSKEYRALVRSEQERIKLYRAKGDLL